MAKNTGNKKRRQKRNKKNEDASDEVIVEAVAEVANLEMPSVSTAIEEEWENEKPLQWGYKPTTSKKRKRKRDRKGPKTSISIDSSVKYAFNLVFDLLKHILIMTILAFVAYFLIIDAEETEIEEMFNDDTEDDGYEGDYYLKMAIGIMLLFLIWIYNIVLGLAIIHKVGVDILVRAHMLKRKFK